MSDALALAAKFGLPTFFVTVTCNPEWPEITSCLRPGQYFHDQPFVVARVFKQKLKNIMAAIGSMFPNAGNIYYVDVGSSILHTMSHLPYRSITL